MKRAMVLALVTLLSISGVVGAQMDGDTIDEISKSVVLIIALQNDEPVWVGSGTIVTSDGLIFTNRHVVEGADDFIIALLDDPNEQPIPTYLASVETMFPYDFGEFELDFATLQIDRDIDGNAIFRTRLDLPFLDTGEFAEARRGDDVYVFGYPTIGDGYFVFTDGLVSSVQNADVGDERIPVFYQTNAEIAPGNSGGLATNADGELLGIPTSVRSEERTSGRLSGIIPFTVIEAAIENQLVRPDAGPSDSGSDTPTSTGNDYEGVDAVCPDGLVIEDGVEIIVVQMRPGFEYTATVVGLDGFDPILGVMPTSDSGGPYSAELCSDDDATAAGYSVSLPTTGDVPPSSRSSRIRFSHSNNDFMNVSFVVGDYNGNPGEFVLTLEGMAVTAGDGQGDPFMFWATPNVLASSVPVSVYMIGAESQLDPLMYIVDLDTMEPIQLDSGALICDDAGTDSCWGNSYALAGATVNRNGRLVTADEYDPMISIPMNVSDTSIPLSFMYMMTSYNQESRGQYIMTFHVGTE